MFHHKKWPRITEVASLPCPLLSTVHSFTTLKSSSSQAGSSVRMAVHGLTSQLSCCSHHGESHQMLQVFRNIDTYVGNEIIPSFPRQSCFITKVWSFLLTPLQLLQPGFPLQDISVPRSYLKHDFPPHSTSLSATPLFLTLPTLVASPSLLKPVSSNMPDFPSQLILPSCLLNVPVPNFSCPVFFPVYSPYVGFPWVGRLSSLSLHICGGKKILD